MKRFASIFLFIVMLITAVQPIIAMHYCGNELSSFQIYQTIDKHDICCNNIDNHDALISDNSCCETEMMKLSTDEYQTKTEQHIYRISPISINTIVLNIVDKLVAPESDSSTLLTSLKFPSTGNYLKDVSLLTYICIYRI